MKAIHYSPKTAMFHANLGEIERQRRDGDPQRRAEHASRLEETKLAEERWQRICTQAADAGDPLPPRPVLAELEESFVPSQIVVADATMEALADVVKQGTATRAKSSIVTIAGKTGTAQTAALRTGPEKDIPKKFRDHAWFVAFAPVDEPKIAVAVLAEHMGHGGSAAAPLAKEVIEAYMKLMPPAQTAGL